MKKFTAGSCAFLLLIVTSLWAQGIVGISGGGGSGGSGSGGATQGVFGTECTTQGAVNFTTDSQMLQFCDGANYDNYGLIAPKSVPSTGWSWLEQGSGVTATLEKGGLSVYSPANVGGYYERAYSTNQECIAEFRMAVGRDNFASAGMYLKGNSPNRLTLLIFQNFSGSGGLLGFVGQRLTHSPIAYNSNPYTSSSTFAYAITVFQRAVYDGTTLRFYIGASQTGPWTEVYSEAASSWVTSGPVACGISIGGGSATTTAMFVPYFAIL